ncbi:ATP-binding protein [Sinorhizobium meliloti]|uniref:ATP-binding protein n=1 Tax=Rhizobium meliloti TaxID=382 RepID=UPI002479108F|nr:ATP-binding protein [Sinorhizobium meliloti]
MSKLAQFPVVRELDDFEAQASPDQGQIRELANCRWIAPGDAELFLGRLGTGKIHLAVSLGREAIRQKLQRPVRHDGEARGNTGEDA